MLRALMRGMGQPHMDVGLRLGKGMQARIIERPGLWMAPADLAALRADLRAVADAGLNGQSLDYGVLSDDPSRLAASVVTLIRDAEGRPVAFNALALMGLRLNGQPVEVLHLGLVMIAPGVRSQGLSWVLYGLTCLLMFARNQFRPLWVSNVTQVPAVIGLVSEGFSNVWPVPGGAGRSFAHTLLARQIMAGHRHVFGVGNDAGFDEDRFVITNAYTGGSDHLKKRYDEAARHRDPRYGDFCREMLDYDRGDDFLQLGQMDMAAARRYLNHAVPRESLRMAVASVGMQGFQGAVLPLLHWLDDRRDWGVLRARRNGDRGGLNDGGADG